MSARPALRLITVVTHGKPSADGLRAIAALLLQMDRETDAERATRQARTAARRESAKAAKPKNQRHGHLKRQTPAWADLHEIEAIYALARQLTQSTGQLHEVDHFYPLRGELVSGLHVHQNLRVLPRAVNATKGNRWEAMP